MSWRKGNRPERKRWRLVRQKVLERDGWRCVKCGKAGRLEVDHQTPLDAGGDVYAMDNLQTLCRACHIAKTASENTRPNQARDAWRAFLALRLAGDV